MILSELISFLKKIDAKPKKSLSQNFLVDPNILSKIVRTAAIGHGDAVLEVGPGPGALTNALLAAGARVFAVEKDRLFARELSRLQTPDRRLAVFEADFLEFDLASLPSPLKIVANLPYHITAPILEKVFDLPTRFTSLTIMVQKEVADRLTAKPGGKTYGSLSVFAQFFTQPAACFKVPASCFYPAPKVDSSVLRLDFLSPPAVDRPAFFSLVRKAFQQRRKMLSTSLQPLFSSDRIKQALSQIGLSPDLRPEKLSLPNWLSLYQKLGSDEHARLLGSAPSSRKTGYAGSQAAG